MGKQNNILPLIEHPDVLKELLVTDEFREIFASVLHAITHIDKERLINAEYSSKEKVFDENGNEVDTNAVVIKVKPDYVIVVIPNPKYEDGLFEKNTYYTMKSFFNIKEENPDEWKEAKVVLINLNNFSNLS